MKRRTFIGLGLGLLVGGGAVVRQALEETDAERLLAAINRRRIARDRRPVWTDLRLGRSARAWAARMAETGVLEHSSVEVPPGSDWVGEIIGVGADLPSVVRAWLDSPEHRRILLFRKARFAGAGAVFDGSRWWFDVQFGH